MRASPLVGLLVFGFGADAHASAPDPCAAFAVAVTALVDDGELDAADELLESGPDGCAVEQLVGALEASRAEAVSVFVDAERRYQEAIDDNRLNQESEDLVERFTAALKLDADLEAARTRIDTIEQAVATTTTTSTTSSTTTIPLDEQVRRLDALGLDSKALDAAAAAVPTGTTLPPELIADIDGKPSFDERVEDGWNESIPVVALIAGLVILLLATWGVSELRGLVRPRLAIGDATGHYGASFAALLRSKLVELSSGGGDAQLSTVQHTLPGPPNLGELNDHLKPIDWVLSNFAFRHWRNVHATLHAPTPAGAQVTLDVRKGSASNSRSLGSATVSTVPRPLTGLDEKSAVAHLIGPAAAWTAIHWRDPRRPHARSVASTDSWKSLGALLAAEHHAGAGDLDRAIESYNSALEHDPHHRRARFKLLVAMQRKYADNPQVLDMIADELERLA